MLYSLLWLYTIMDSKLRSFVKSLSWRLIATTNGILVAYALTGSFSKGAVIGIVGNITGMVLYYIHERSWNVFNWGRK